MDAMKTRIFFALCLAVIPMMGCSLSGNPRPDTGVNPTEPAATEALDTPTPTPPPDPVPVTFNDGLASLDSYRLNVIVKSVGPDPAQSNTTDVQSQRSSDNDASVTRYTSTVISPDGEGPEISDTTSYRIGNDQCSGSDDGGWEWTSMSPAQAEMQGLVTSMLGMTPIIDDPVFVAAETVNGAPTNHFAFQVSGLGSSSGAVVNMNQGDYWLAVDGQYIVKYLLIVEMSEAANSEVLSQEISIDLNDINQPVSIAFPQGCLDVAPPPTATP
jgi:hypothetical protein